MHTETIWRSIWETVKKGIELSGKKASEKIFEDTAFTLAPIKFVIYIKAMADGLYSNIYLLSDDKNYDNCDK